MRQHWVCILGVVAGLGAAPRPAAAGQAMAVIDRWNQWNHGSLTIVTPDAADTVRWVQAPVTGIPTRVLSVTDWLKEKGPREHEQTLLLYRRDEAAGWPADVFAKKASKCPRRPSEIPPDEVCTVAWPYGGHEWGILLLAPDEPCLKLAYDELLKTDMNRFATDGAAVTSWRVVDAVGVARDARLVDGWLQRQGTRTQRVRGRVLSPAGLPASGPPETPLTVVALTYEQYRQLSDADRKALTALLSPGAAAALEAGNDNTICSEVQRDGGRIRVCVVAPAERFLKFALSAPSEAEAAGVPDALAALRLPGPERPGGRFELVDLRGLGKARMLPKAPDAALAANAEVLASRLRRYLADAGRWEFTEFAAPDLAMVMQLRLEQVSGRTEYAAADPVRLTADPGGYNLAEPTKPSPDARAYGLFGPKLYPQGDADPKYVKDVANWRDLHDAWERKRRDYLQRRNAMDVEWQQTVVTSWSANVRASLELYQKDKLLASVPVDVTVRKRGEQTRKSQVRGFEDLPAPLVLPENRDNCPDALVDEALTAAAQQATGRVQLLALLPNDPGAPARTAVGTPGAGGTSTAKSEGGAPIIVEADGIAAATVDPANREDVARRDGCRAAVEKAIGVYVESATRIEKSELMLDTVRTNATGWARVLDVVRRQEDADGLRLTIRAEVQRRPMLKVLIENGLLRQWRLIVVVPDRDAGTSPAEDSLVHACLDAGFPVIDRAQSEQLRHNRELLDAIDNDPKAAMRLRTMSKAEILVTGRLAAEGAQEVAGQMACRARLAIKAIDLNTGEILAQESREAGATEATAEMARSAAATRCADMVADPLVDRILQRPQPAQGQARIEITIKKVKSAGMAADIQEAMAKLPGVKKVTELEFQRDVHLKLEVMVDQELAGRLAVQLERAEELKPFGILVDGKTTATIECTASGPP